MPRFSFASLRVRLLVLVLLAIVPTLGLMLYTNFDLRRMVVTEVRDDALRLARLAAKDQEDSIRDARQLLFALSQLPVVRNSEPTACSNLFAQLLRQYPQYALLGAVRPDGEIFCSAYPTSGPTNEADQVYFQRVIETRDFAVSDYQIDDLSGKATLDFGYPVLDETGQVEAIVFASLDLSWLNQLAAEARLPRGSTFTVIDRNGTILVRYPDPEVWVGQSVPEAPIVDEILSHGGEGTTEALGVDNTPRLFAFTPLYGIPGSGNVYVNIGIPTEVAFAEANRVLVRNLIVFGLAALLAVAAAWFGGHWFILRWVDGLVSATKRLSAGDLSTRTGLPYGQGELSQLAYAFDEMARSLERSISARSEAEEARRESERTLATLLSNLSGMAYRGRNDSGRTMEFVSEGCFDLTGYTPTDLINNQKISFMSLIHPDDRRTVWDKVQTAVQQGQPFQMTYRLVTAADRTRWVWEQGRGVFSKEGNLLALEGFITDTTERVQAYQNLEQRVADRTRELTALYDVTAVASKSLDLNTILESSLEHVLAVMGCEAGAIHLYDETKHVLRLASWQGLPADVVSQTEAVGAGAGLVGWVLAHQEALVIANIATDPRAAQATLANGSQAYLGAPMRARGQVLGVLSVIRDSAQPFKGEEVALLASIADEVGVATKNAQLYDAERARRHQADTLLQVTSIVGSTLELDEVLARILNQLRRVVDYDSALIQLIEEDKLETIAARGFTNVERVLGASFAPDEAPNHSVVNEGRVLNLADAPARYPVFRRPPFNRVHSWLGVPLRVQEQIIGVIAVGRQQPGGYDPEEVRLTTAFADQAALALENARLYQQAEQLAVMEERSRLARELHDSVTQSLYSLTLFAEVGRRAADADNLSQTLDYLNRLGEVSQQALREMRLLVYELRTTALETEGLVGAIQQRLDAVEKRAGVEARLLVESMVKLPALIEEGLYRIAQEALNNALKHAAATSVMVRIKADDEAAVLEVIDNGQAFDPDSLDNSGGMGLTNMRERAEQLDGTLTIVSKPGEGTSVKATVPTRRSWSRPILPVEKISEVS